MATEFSGGSSQQPFASPQPAPVPQTNPVASPPTKQSLKTWAKWFKGPNKHQETHGNFSDLPSLFASSHPHARNQSIFQEHAMDHVAPTNDNDGSLSPKIKLQIPFRRVSGRVSLTSTRPTAPSKTMREDKAKKWTPSGVFGKSDGLQQKPLDKRRASVMGFDSTSRTTTSMAGAPEGVSPQASARRPTSVNGLLDVFNNAKPQSASDEKNRRQSFHSEPAGSHENATEATMLPSPKVTPVTRVLEFFAFSRSANFIWKIAKQTVKTVEPPTGIFGVPLRQSITYANVAISLVDAEGKSYIYGYVPIVVAKCGVYLKEKATNVEGIFRLSGSEKRIKELKTIFDSPDRYGKGLDWAGYTVHDAANVLRRYLNQLPEPIVPLDLYDRFREPLRGHTMQAVGDSGEGPQLSDNFDVAKAIVTYQQLITELPPLNRQLLLYILDLLAVFASKSDENRMTSNNLAAIFQPGMLSHPSHDMAPKEYRLSQDVLIFLIENQDHFLIGMRGTAADEQTVQEVSNGGTPPPGTPNTSGIPKALGRSASNASAGADDVRKYGGVRRNVSVSSRHSRQSNGAPSPASPAYGVSLSSTPPGGVHRSNTVPSKRSPALPSSRLQKASASPSPNNSAFPSSQLDTLQDSSPTPADKRTNQSNVAPVVTTTGIASLAPSSNPTSATSQERLLPENDRNQDVSTPTRERAGLFNRSPTTESERKQPNKLRKKRLPGSSNPSAHSSQQSLHANQPNASPTVLAERDAQNTPVEHVALESIPSAVETPTKIEAAPSSEMETPRPEQRGQMDPPQGRPEDPHHSSDQTLKPKVSPVSSLHSHSSVNDLSQSDADHDTVAAAEQKEKRPRWRLSRRREDSQSFGANLTPKKGLGSDSNAAASTSSIGSSARNRKSFTGDTVVVGSDSTLAGTHQQSSNESGSPQGPVSEEKKGPLGWIKNKMREKREEKEAEREKERTKSPPASTDRFTSSFSARGKSVELKREEHPERIVEEPAVPQIQAPAQEQQQHSQANTQPQPPQAEQPQR